MEYQNAYKLVINECEEALSKISVDDVDRLITMITNADKVFFVGVGRVLLELEAFAKRLAHIGIETVIVGQITEPAFTENDVLIVGSGSGESLVSVAIAKKAKQIGGKIVHIGSNTESSIKNMTDLMVRIPVQTKLYREDEITSDQPMSSLFEQSLLLLGDTVAKMIVEEKKIELKSLWRCHANLE